MPVDMPEPTPEYPGSLEHPGRPTMAPDAPGDVVAQETTYANPHAPGAPRVGDVAVVVRIGYRSPDCPTNLRAGTVGLVEQAVTPSTFLHLQNARWLVRPSPHGWAAWAHTVRWPTPAELAAYRLAQGAP